MKDVYDPTPPGEPASYLPVTTVLQSIPEYLMSETLAIVTGASSGIGLSLAKELASRGYDLVVCSASRRLPAAADTIRSSGTDIIEVTADLSTREGVDLLWKNIADLGRPVDIACINAGVGVGGQFWETDLEEELTMIELNCTGTVQLAKHIVRHMRQLNAGRILFTSSIAGEMVAPREAVYAATKAFVLSFAHSLRYELRGTGITITALQPGPTDTDFFHRAGMDDTQVGSEGKKQSNPDDVAKDGIEALFAGKDHVYSHSMSTKLEGAVANFVPGSIKASMHENMAKPQTDE
jgi:short-subunit dehydrogenase